jgi:hypothetical protein
MNDEKKMMKKKILRYTHFWFHLIHSSVGRKNALFFFCVAQHGVEQHTTKNDHKFHVANDEKRNFNLKILF